MPKDRHVLFIQKRSARAGAQTSLARMMASSLMKDLRPAVLLGTEGWLHDHLQELGIPIAKSYFHRPRRLQVRLTGLGSFGKATSRILREAGIRPWVIVANDHTECPLALELSRCYGGIPVLAILRTPGMTRRDFEKFQCDECDHLLVEGEELKSRLSEWTKKKPGLFEEGFCDEELHPPVPWCPEFPSRLLVTGSEKPRKGFTDFLRAVDLLEERYPDFPTLHCDFTGLRPVDEEELLSRPRRAKCHYLGRVNDYVGLVRNYSLVIHPSRAETFGMAPLEAILAGVATMASTTGAVEELSMPAEWTFPPYAPEAIADRLHALWKAWPQQGAEDFLSLQGEIMRKFHIDRTVSITRRALMSMKDQRTAKRHGFMISVLRRLR